MSDITLKMRFGKLNSLLYRSAEKAVVLSKRAGNTTIGLEHWLLSIVEMPGLDVELILKEFKLSPAAIKRELQAQIDALPKSAAGTSDFDYLIPQALDAAWLSATLQFRVSAVRSSHLLVAMLNTVALRQKLGSIAPTLTALSVDRLVELFDTKELRSQEDGLTSSDGFGVGLPNDPVRRELFVSYRRSEAEHVTGRLFDHLVMAFSFEKVFKDVNSILAGSRDFVEELQKELAAARVVVAVIGPNWLTVRDESGRRRLDDENDFVRAEIAWALEKKLPIVPVLFDGAKMPTAAELPEPMQALARCQAMRLAGDPDFQASVRKLVNACRQHMGGEAEAEVGAPT